MKYLCMLLFHRNKDSRSKDQNKNEFCFISPAIKTIVNRVFLMVFSRVFFFYYSKVSRCRPAANNRQV